MVDTSQVSYDLLAERDRARRNVEVVSAWNKIMTPDRNKSAEIAVVRDDLRRILDWYCGALMIQSVFVSNALIPFPKISSVLPLVCLTVLYEFCCTVSFVSGK